MSLNRNRHPLILWALAAALIAPAHAAPPKGAPVTPGVELVQILNGPDASQGPTMIHAVIVDPRAPGVRVAAVLGGDTVEEQPGNGMEAVTQTVIRAGAVAGLNADFFPFTGDPLGLAIQKGELVSEIRSGRGSIGFRSDGSAIMGRPRYSGAVSAEGDAEMELAGLNRVPGAGELVLFAPIYGETTPNKAATVVTLDAKGAVPTLQGPLRATVVSLQEAEGKIAIPKDRLLLTGSGPAADWLRKNAVPGKALTIRTRLAEEGKDWSQVMEAVSGGPVLLTNGKPDLQLEAEGIGKDFSTTRHPRSAVGVTKDGKILLVAVDGRQTLSRGMSLPELTEAMLQLGAVDALNLDGGGSTALTVRGLVINSPSDGVVRRVANSLLVFAPGQTPIPAPVESKAPAQVRVAVAGPAVSLAEYTGENGAGWVYGTRNGGAFVDQTGRVHGFRGGSAEVVAQRANGAVARLWTVEVVPGPPAKTLTAWKDGRWEITVRDVNNGNLAGQTVRFTQPDGAATEAVTGADGKAATPAGWLKDNTAPVTVTVGTLRVTLPQGS